MTTETSLLEPLESRGEAINPDPQPIHNVVLIVNGDRRDIPCNGYQEAVKRATHERAYWAGEPDVTIYIEPGF